MAEADLDRWAAEATSRIRRIGSDESVEPVGRIRRLTGVMGAVDAAVDEMLETMELREFVATATNPTTSVRNDFKGGRESERG